MGKQETAKFNITLKRQKLLEALAYGGSRGVSECAIRSVGSRVVNDCFRAQLIEPVYLTPDEAEKCGRSTDEVAEMRRRGAVLMRFPMRYRLTSAGRAALNEDSGE